MSRLTASPQTLSPLLRLLAALLLLLPLFGGLLFARSASGITPAEATATRARSQLQAVREELESAREDAATHELALEEADRQLNAAFDAVEEAARAVNAQRDAVADASDRLAAAQLDLEAHSLLMAERIAEMYREIRPDSTLILMSATSMSDAIRQSTYMTAIGRDDRAVVEGLASAERRVAGERQSLEEEQDALESVLVSQEAVLEEVEEMRDDTALLAAASEELVARLQAREHHLAAEEAQLVTLANQAPRSVVPDTATTVSDGGSESTTAPTEPESADQESPGADHSDDPAPTPSADDSPTVVTAPGTFSWPTSGTVTSGYGSRWGRLHAGIDIANSTGTAIGAARGGTVTHAGPMSGYGNLVLIAHGDGLVSAYAHLESIAVSSGQSVSTGTYLGGMGCTGSCTGTHLHFEIRVNGGAVDPMGYL